MANINNNLVHGGSRLEYSTKETAQLIRQALKSAFPGQKFSVTTKYGSCYSATDIQWTDGPTEPEVQRITNQFSSKSFDGMTDSTNYHEQVVDGQRVQYSGWVNTTRRISATLLEKALVRLQLDRAAYGLPQARVTVKENGSYPFVDGPDVNAEAGISSDGKYRYRFQYVSDAVQSIAYHLRPNGCRITLK